MDFYKRLIVRFFQEDLDEVETLKLKEWLQESEKNRKKFDRYNEIWQITPGIINIDNHFIERKWDELDKQIKKELHPKAEKLIVVNPTKYLLLKVASVAALLIGFVLASIFFIEQQKNKIQTFYIQAPQGEKAKVLLDDGTNVWLNSGSELSWQSNYGDDERIVRLVGEGFFDVSKSKKIFIVKTGNIDVKVYGTRFNVSSYLNDENIETTLEEGSISIGESGSKNTTLITPDQSAIFNKESGNITLLTVNTDMYTSWKDNKLKFDNAPFGEVVKKLERWYGIKIILNSSLSYSERYTMTIKTESLREVLAMIQKTTPMKYIIEEEKVYILPVN